MTNKIPLLDFEEALKTHDWFYSYSEDPTVYAKGQEEYSKLREQAAQSEAHRDLFFTYFKEKFPTSGLLKESIKLIE